MIVDSNTLTFLDNGQVYAVDTNLGAPDAPPPPTDSTLIPSGGSTMPYGTPTQTTPTAPTGKFRFAAPTGPASDVPTPSSGLATFGTAPTATLAPTTTTAPTTSTPSTSGGITSGPTSVVSSGDDLIRSLMDLIAAQYSSGGGVPGGGTGFGGLVSGPLAGSDFVSGDTGTAAAPASHKGLWILALLVAGIGYWYYRSHKKRKAA